MLRIRSIFCLVLVLSACISCHKNDDSTYFNGEIRTIEDNIEDVKSCPFRWSKFRMAIDI